MLFVEVVSCEFLRPDTLELTLNRRPLLLDSIAKGRTDCLHVERCPRAPDDGTPHVALIVTREVVPVDEIMFKEAHGRPKLWRTVSSPKLIGESFD